MLTFSQNPAPAMRSARRATSSWRLIAVAAFLSLLVGAFAGLVGGIAALLISLFLVVAVFAIVDYRFGVLLAVFILPLSSTQLMPREMLGITGFNPLNLLIVISIFSLVLTRPFMRTKLILPEPPGKAWLLVALIVVWGVYGSFYVSSIPYHMMQTLTFKGQIGYLVVIMLRPLLFLVVAYLLAVLVANAKVPERLLTPLFVSTIIVPIAALLLIFTSGLPLSMLASSHARGFLSRLGVHANELGLMFNMAFALVLFTWAQLKHPVARLLLIGVGGLLAVAVVLTFSRGGMLGLGAVVMYFLFTAKRFPLMLGTLLVAVVAAMLMPSAVVERATAGVATRNVYAISAGRVDDIWLPLLPDVARSPIIGHGLSSVLWSEATRTRAILPVGHPHSAYLGVLLDFGVVGAVVVFLFYRHLWRYFGGLSLTHREAVWRGYFKGAQACILLLLVQGITDDRFIPTFPQVFMWLSYGIAVGLSARKAAPAPTIGQSDATSPIGNLQRNQ